MPINLPAPARATQPSRPSREMPAGPKIGGMDAAAYLARIGYDGALAPTAATLRALHRAHMMAVPFENLDIFGARRHLTLDPEAFFAKVVGERRGGFCYELNGLFAELLRALGFEVHFLSARVAKGTKAGPEFDHMLLLVPVEGVRWIADVGFGDSSLVPLDFDLDGPQGEPAGTFKLVHDGAEPGFTSMYGLTDAQKWVERYRFALVPHPLADFAGMCEYHQVSPESKFVQNRVCSLPTAAGRITLSGNRLTLVEGGRRTVQRLDEDAFLGALRERFGIDLS